MVNYIYLGYGVTDSNGVAKLDHDANGDPISHSYTGTGAGEIDIVASLDNPIGEGSIQSETYSIIDALKKYTAISDFYQNASADLSLTDGVFSKTSGSVMPLNPSTSTRYFTTAMTFEFEVENANTLSVQIGESSKVFNKALSTLGASNGSTVKIVYDGTEITPFVDGVEKTSHIVSFTHTTQYYFNLFNSGSWKNFRVY